MTRWQIIRLLLIVVYRVLIKRDYLGLLRDLLPKEYPSVTEPKKHHPAAMGFVPELRKMVRGGGHVLLAVLLLAGVAMAAGQITVTGYPPVPVTIKGGDGINIAGGVITATGIPAGGVTATTFNAYTSAGGGRATNDRVDTVQEQVTAQAVGSALGATAVQPTDLSSSTTSTATNVAANSAAVKTAYDLAAGKLSPTGDGSGLTAVKAVSLATADNKFGIYPTNTGGYKYGRITSHETSWLPSVPLLYDWAGYRTTVIDSVGLGDRAGKDANQLWNSNVAGDYMKLTSSANMAGSHLIGNNMVVVIPTGVGDGGGTNADPEYQEIATFEGYQYFNSSGHLGEGIGSYSLDNGDGNSLGTNSKWANFYAGLYKNVPDSTYGNHAFWANSFGPQQTTHAPDTIIYGTGGFKRGIDFTSATFNDSSIAIKLAPNHKLSDGTNSYTLLELGSGGVSDHGALTGLADDDHSQYALLAGRSTGQTLDGGTGASENLTLSSTQNATKGKLIFGTSVYDEANNRLGIGTASPSVGLHVVNPSTYVEESLEGYSQFGANLNLRSGRGTQSSPTVALNGDRIGAIFAVSYNGSAFSPTTAILSEVDGETTSGINNPGRMTFWTSAYNTTRLERLRITSTGTTGIGTTAPESQLDINSATGANLQLTYNDSNGSAANKVNFATSSTGDLTITPSGGDTNVVGTTKSTQFADTPYAPAAGTTFTVDLANGMDQELTTNGNVTITLPTPVAGKSYTVTVKYGGAHTVTWAGGGTIKWANGTAPTATSVSGKYDVYVFKSDATSTYTMGADGGRNF